MQPSRDPSIRAISPLPKIIDNCFAQSGPYHSELYNSEIQNETIAQLRQRLRLERLLRQIIERLFNSLDQDQILQMVVQELTTGLGVEGCNLALYDLAQAELTRGYECLSPEIASIENPVALSPIRLNQTLPFASQPDLYQQLLQGQIVQFCQLQGCMGSRLPGNEGQFSYLACPIQDEAGMLGDLWLFKLRKQWFSSPEIWLIEQVAHQCAIALRKTDLHQQTKTRVDELERLHRLKDDFLSTVSHELRTPISNIKMAIQLLEMHLEDLDAAKLTSARRYLKILNEETAHEITLINNLLDLSRLEAGTESLVITTVNPVFWLPSILEPFMERAKLQQQQFQVDLATYLPSLTTDLGHLERILSELLNNACKYTPTGNRIIVSVRLLKGTAGTAQTRMPIFLFSITNSGIEIPAAQQERIFEKFYRIPGHESCQQSGTGLGLALVKGLVERLSGQIRIESYAGLTRFTVELPSRPPNELEG